MRFTKRIKIAPGIKLNISKSGISGTFGAKGASVNIGKNGTYLNTGIPGTGISNRKKLSEASSRSQSSLVAEAPTGDSESEAITPIKSPFPIITDLPKAKKGLRNLYLITAILIILGLISLPTVILPVLFFAGAIFFLFGVRNIKKQIKMLEAETKAYPSNPKI